MRSHLAYGTILLAFLQLQVAVAWMGKMNRSNWLNGDMYFGGFGDRHSHCTHRISPSHLHSMLMFFSQSEASETPHQSVIFLQERGNRLLAAMLRQL
jgi:hypothetical protein